MNNFPKTIEEAALYLNKVKLWALIAIVAAVIVVGFYSLTGWRYWHAWDQSRGMTSQIQRINAKLALEPPADEHSAKDLALNQSRLDYFESMYEHDDVSELIGIISTTSWDSGVELPSISAGDPLSKVIGNTRYQTQFLSLTAQGDVKDIYGFLSNLQEKLPALSVSNISVSEPGPTATSQIQLTFYLRPEAISEEEAAD